MAEPHVQIAEADTSTRVPSFPGVYGAIAIPNARKGPVGVPTLVTSETQLLKLFTPEDRIEVGYDLAYYSALAFLQKSNKLWVVRPDDGSTYGAVTVITGGTPSVAAATPLADQAAIDGYVFVADEALMFYAANPGVWNNKVSVSIRDYSAKEADAFLVKVYYDGVQVEEHVCSRVEGKRDGHNRNIFIETALEASYYVRALNNPLVATNVALPWTESAGADAPVAMTNAADGSAVIDADVILSIADFYNKDQIPMTILLDGGRATTAYQTELITIAESRKDCVALLSVPYDKEASSDYLNDVVDYRNTILNANTSYAALYSPHVKIYDKYNDRNIYVSPEGYVGAIISQTAGNYELWYPPGGFRRGIINVLDVRRRYSSGERDYLYDSGINPIRFAPGKGIVVWGQKTLSARPSALDRLNVRLLLIVIEPAIAEALEDFLFEINDEATRVTVSVIIESYMNNIKARRGVYDFDVICDETNNTPEDIDANKMNVWLFVQPTRSIEYIKFTTVITRTGMSVELAAQSL